MKSNRDEYQWHATTPPERKYSQFKFKRRALTIGGIYYRIVNILVDVAYTLAWSIIILSIIALLIVPDPILTEWRDQLWNAIR